MNAVALLLPCVKAVYDIHASNSSISAHIKLLSKQVLMLGKISDNFRKLPLECEWRPVKWFKIGPKANSPCDTCGTKYYKYWQTVWFILSISICLTQFKFNVEVIWQLNGMKYFKCVNCMRVNNQNFRYHSASANQSYAIFSRILSDIDKYQWILWEIYQIIRERCLSIWFKGIS